MNTVRIDFSKKVTAIRPLHGVNNGPRTYSFFHNTSEYFVEAGIPFARLHDTEYPYGSGHFVDIPCIFKNWDADENDPASYDFEFTDMYLQAILDVGTEVFFRLGVSIEHAPIKRNIRMPKDFNKWARICEHIVRHYNEGWANGHEWNIRYWEIWNEPVSIAMWLGSTEDYCRLYSITANHLKKCFGDSIKVGGFASSGFTGCAEKNPAIHQQYLLEFADDFFKYITAPETKAPLDFLSWHLYTRDVYMLESCAQYARKLLKDHGFENAESILDEWNYSGPDMFNEMRNETGAAFAAGCLIAMQHNGVNVGCYYDAQPSMCYCGIFSLETRKPTKAFYSLKAWNELYKLGTEVESSSGSSDIRVCAAKNENEAGILVSCFGNTEKNLRINTCGLGFEKTKATVYAIDKTNFYEVIEESEFTGDTVIQRSCDDRTTFYIKLERIPE